MVYTGFREGAAGDEEKELLKFQLQMQGMVVFLSYVISLYPIRLHCKRILWFANLRHAPSQFRLQDSNCIQPNERKVGVAVVVGMAPEDWELELVEIHQEGLAVETVVEEMAAASVAEEIITEKDSVAVEKVVANSAEETQLVAVNVAEEMTMKKELVEEETQLVAVNVAEEMTMEKDSVAEETKMVEEMHQEGLAVGKVVEKTTMVVVCLVGVMSVVVEAFRGLGFVVAAEAKGIPYTRSLLCNCLSSRQCNLQYSLNTLLRTRIQ